jgi:MFS superfamily sulfate permease-like transporter
MGDATAPRLAPEFGDLVAGVSIPGLLLPEAVAYSGISGVPPQAGVIALLAGLVSYRGLSAFTQSRQISTTMPGNSWLRGAPGILPACSSRWGH